MIVSPNKFAVKSIRSNAAHAASQVRKTPIGGLRGDVAQLISLADDGWLTDNAVL